MNRRKSIKAILLGTASTGLVLEACKNTTNQKPDAKADAFAGLDRMVEEKEAFEKVIKEQFFNEHEMATIAILCDIIIPRDAVSGSATDAKVPDFIEFIVKDKPELQTPLRGGLRWLDMQCLKKYNATFATCNQQQQISMVDAIAYPQKAKPNMQQGVSFFNLMRNLTATGFYTSEIGVKDIDYQGNKPNQWNGVPNEVLKQYGVAYTEKELKECISFNS